MRITIFGIAAAAVLSLATASAWAQEDEDPLGGEPVGDEVDLPVDDPLPADGDSPEGSEENPDAPKLAGDEDATKKAPPMTKAGYPIEIVARPITLIGGMSEVTYRIPLSIDPFVVDSLLTADYGITSRIQLGLRYGTGSLTTGDDGGFEPGKAVGIEVHYLITDIVALQVGVPIMLDPFGAGIVLGAPLKWRATDELALFVGRDLITIRVAGFVPVLESAAANAALTAADKLGLSPSDGAITVKGGAIYQLSPDLALTGELGYLAQDFKGDEADMSLFFHLTHSPSNMIDLGGSFGSFNLDDAVDNLRAVVFAAVRI